MVLQILQHPTHTRTHACTHTHTPAFSPPLFAVLYTPHEETAHAPSSTHLDSAASARGRTGVSAGESRTRVTRPTRGRTGGGQGGTSVTEVSHSSTLHTHTHTHTRTHAHTHTHTHNAAFSPIFVCYHIHTSDKETSPSSDSGLTRAASARGRTGVSVPGVYE